MSEAISTSLQPLTSFIKFDSDGKPYLQGCKCENCGEVLLENHRGCPSCAKLGTLHAFRLSEQGKLFTYTIVHRSFPGIDVPFVSAIVKLDGGGFIKGNLVNVPPSPEELHFDMPVRVKFDVIKATKGGETPLVRHVFVPIDSTEAR